MDPYKKLNQIINDSHSIVFFTGAGISVPSHIPDFRSSNGLYNENYGHYRPEEIISHSFFLSHPGLFYEFYFSKMVYPTSKPNEAHYFIADLAKIKSVTVVTQNIDNLHTLAGSPDVVELHGNVYRNACMNCGKFYTLEDVLKLGGDIPHCPRCGGVIKPDVVLYEEALDEENINRAIKAISACDTLIVIGSSLVVYPAASFIRYYRGNHLICINKESTQYDAYCELVFHEDVISVVKKLKEQKN